MVVQYLSVDTSFKNKRPSRFFSSANIAHSWSAIPHRIRRKFRSTRSKLRTRQSPASRITSLETSINPADTLKSLRAHQWSAYDAQYVFLAFIAIFSLCIIQSPGPGLKSVVAILLLTSLLFPITRQFFLPFLPVAAWLIFFYACGQIPGDYRPPIWTRVLPGLENILYGANLSNILSAHKSTFLTVLAWLPYGITHFGAPFVCHALVFLFGPPGSTPVFARAFGYMNLFGVMIQLCFPCSPPWYENIYGLAKANYHMAGSPAGLAAVDKLFGMDLYTSTFTASPMVFGAFPSLHSGCATLEALFMSYFFPKLRIVFVFYTLWLWWATMYLSHHYAVDLVGGSLLSAAIFFVTRSTWLPRLQRGKFWRWDYDYVEFGTKHNSINGRSTRNSRSGVRSSGVKQRGHEYDLAEWDAERGRFVDLAQWDAERGRFIDLDIDSSNNEDSEFKSKKGGYDDYDDNDSEDEDYEEEDEEEEEMERRTRRRSSKLHLTPGWYSNNPKSPTNINHNNSTNSGGVESGDDWTVGSTSSFASGTSSTSRSPSSTGRILAHHYYSSSSTAGSAGYSSSRGQKSPVAGSSTSNSSGLRLSGEEQNLSSGRDDDNNVMNTSGGLHSDHDYINKS